MRILLIGNKGFLGSSVEKELFKNYNPKEIFLASLSTGFDLRDYSQVKKLFEEVRPEIVINCAAHVGGIQYGLSNAARIFHDNTQMILNIFKGASDYQVKRLINPISNCAYPGKLEIYEESFFWDGPVDDSVFTYGNTRRLMMVAAKSYLTQDKLDTVSIVFPNLYGPRDHFDEYKSHALGALISKIMKAKETGKKSVTIWGSGKPIREWLYIDDAARAIVNAIKIKPYPEVINLGTGKGVSIIEMAEKIRDIADWQGSFTFDQTKKDGAPKKIIEGTRGNLILGINNFVDFNKGLRKTLDFYIENYIKRWW